MESALEVVFRAKCVYDLYHGLVFPQASPFLPGLKNFELFSDALGTTSKGVAVLEMINGGQPAVSEELYIDVSSTRRTTSNLRGLKVAVTSVLIIVALCFGGIAYEFLTFGAVGRTYFISAVIGVVGLFNLWLALLGLRGLREPAQSALIVNSSGLTLKCDGGVTLTYPWSNRRAPTELYRLNRPPTDGGPEAYLALPGRGWIPLSFISADRVMEIAEEVGVSPQPHNYRIKYRGPATRYVLRHST